MVPEAPVLYGVPLEEARTHFWDYWMVLSRRRWTVIGVFLTTVIAATMWVFTTRPVYTATATLRIDKEPPHVVKFEGVLREGDHQADYYQTQYKMLQGRTLINRVIGLLQLDQHPEFRDVDREVSFLKRAETAVREYLVRWIPIPPPAVPEDTQDLALASPMTAAFQKRLSIEPVRHSRLVNISFDSYAPDVAARVANALVDAFIAQQLDQRIEATQYASQFLAKQLEEARHNLAQTEQALNGFLKAHDIIFLVDRGGQTQDLITQQLGILSDALLKARAERIAKESAAAQVGSVRDVGTLPAILQSGLIAQLKQELAVQEAEHKRLGQQFKPEYPRMQQLARKIAEIRKQLGEEIDRGVQALQLEYQSAARNERELEGALVKQRALARGLSEHMSEYNRLRRDVDTNRELYTALLGRLRETQVSAALLTSNLSVVDRADIPIVPSHPRKGLTLVMACLAGAVSGVGLAFFLEYLDTNIKDTTEVETLLRVPALGQVPSRAAFDRLLARRGRLTDGEAEALPFALVANAEMPSVFAEAFRSLRTAILYSAPDRPPKSLMVTSLNPQDGKTSLVTNLAVTLAQLGGSPVLLVDADMRRPMIHEVLGLEASPGLSSFLTGQADLDEIVVPSGMANLFVIPAGPIPVNPAELLASARLREAIERLGRRFAHVVFDSGPIFGVSDAGILAGQVEGTILVLRQGRASRDAAQRAVRMLISVRARMLGVILNDTDVHAPGYDYYHAYN